MTSESGSSWPNGCYDYQMEELITIDAVGRLVVPKAMRTSLNLREGSRLRIREENGHLVLEPISNESVPVDVDGLLVIRGRLEVPDHRVRRADRVRSLGRFKR